MSKTVGNDPNHPKLALELQKMQGNCAIRDELSESCRQSWQVGSSMWKIVEWS